MFNINIPFLRFTGERPYECKVKQFTKHILKLQTPARIKIIAGFCILFEGHCWLVHNNGNIISIFRIKGMLETLFAEVNPKYPLPDTYR